MAVHFPRSGAAKLRKRLMTRREVAGLFEVSPNTIARWTQAGKLPFCVALGGQHRYPRAEIRKIYKKLQAAFRIGKRKNGLPCEGTEAKGRPS